MTDTENMRIEGIENRQSEPPEVKHSPDLSKGDAEEALVYLQTPLEGYDKVKYSDDPYPREGTNRRLRRKTAFHTNSEKNTMDPLLQDVYQSEDESSLASRDSTILKDGAKTEILTQHGEEESKAAQPDGSEYFPMEHESQDNMPTEERTESPD